MSVSTLKIGKKEFVVIPRRRYEQLTQAEQDRKDAMLAEKAMQDYLDGKLNTVSHEEVKRRLGL